jgi:predicted phage tail protein
MSPASFTWIIDLTNPTALPDSISTWQTTLNIPVSWSGSDNLTGIDYFDVQVRQDLAGWTDWLSNTTASTEVFLGLDGAEYAFRVRAVDGAGNIGDWSSAVMSTVDATAPVASLDALQPGLVGTFPVSWRGNDATSGIATYDVEFKVDESAWQTWLGETDQTSALFTSTTGSIFAFRVRAEDIAGNLGAWSPVVSTKVGSLVFLPVMISNH